MAQRVGLYGGSFDPIHCGHLIIARAVAEHLDLDRVVFLPTAAPPHKEGRTLADPDARAAMVNLSIEGEPLFSFSDFDLTREGPSYTIDTVTHFKDRFGPDVVLYWIIGADSLAELATWHQAQQLVDACHVVTAARAGWEQPEWDSLGGVLDQTAIEKLKAQVIETPVIEISATEVRRRVREGKSIRHMVPDAVRAYVRAHRLYRIEP